MFKRIKSEVMEVESDEIREVVIDEGEFDKGDQQ